MTDWNPVVPGPYTEIVPQVRNALATLEAAITGGGDVTGPASAVNNRIAVFDGTTGKLIKDGGSTIAEIVAGSGGLVTSVFGRTGNVVAATNDYTFAQIDKTTSSLADLTTRSASDLSSGTLPDGRFPATLPAISGTNLTSLNASNLSSGTVAAGRMPALTGDVTTTVGTVATTITNNAVSLAKLADIATASFLGRNTAATGDPEVLSTATAKTMLNLTGTNSGDVTLAGENYLSIAGQVITANAVNLAGSNVTGTLPSSKGGTSSTFFAVAGPSALRTYTFPDTNSTIARTDAGQTFAGTNNFEHLLPALTDTYDLGSSIKLWRKGWLSELDAVLFAQNTASLIGGWLIIGKNEGTIPVGQDVGTADTSIDFGQAMTPNDFVVFRAALQVEYAQVGTLVSGTRYNVTRNVDGSGANAWVAGTVYLVLGNTGNGRIELNSNSTPRISLITQGSAYNTQTELLRVGDLNGSWGVAVETYGFAVGQYGVAGKSSLRIDDSGIRFFNNVTERIRLLADGSGYLANSAIAWDTSGNLTVTGNATIAGWSIGSTALSNGTTYIASGFDPPSGAISWFGKAGAAGFQGWNLRDSSNRHIGAFVGSGSAYPYMSIFDGTHYRVILGSLNQAFEADGATNSIGMKIFSTSGAKLVEFSDTQNIIAGWTIATTKISSTGIDIHSGASAALAFGTTPPTSASAGTGIWLDRTGLYGLLSNVVQVKLDVTTGALQSGSSGDAVLNASGITLRTVSSGGKGSVSTAARIKWALSPTEPIIGELSALRASSTTTNFIELWGHGFTTTDTVGITQLAASSDETENANSVYLKLTGDGPNSRAYANLFGNSNFKGLLIGSASTLAASTVLELRSTTGALLVTRMTTTERDALTPSDGMILYNSTLATLQYRKAGAWVSI